VSALESVMLVCFGLSWPINVMKAYKSRTARGMSLPFITLIITGYLAGISAKFMAGKFNYVLAVYFLNLAIVTVNLLMYFRNKALDKANGITETNIDKRNADGSLAIDMEDYIMKSYSKDIAKYNSLNSFSAKNAVVLFGETDDKDIPVTEISESMSLKEKVYNRSIADLSISAAAEVYDAVVAPIKPSTVLVHIGSGDVDFYNRFPGRFDHDYRTLIQHIKETNKNCRIGIVAVKNPGNVPAIDRMNEQLKFIAESEKCEFCNITADTKWSPAAVKAAYDYYYSTGYASNAKKPVYDLAKLFFGTPVMPVESEDEVFETSRAMDPELARFGATV
ncbi:MAG: hypothetical protein MJ097_07245, partial [Dorea sp.]|nr:hypothetical protein [Dorea sp.]